MGECLIAFPGGFSVFLVMDSGKKKTMRNLKITCFALEGEEGWGPRLGGGNVAWSLVMADGASSLGQNRTNQPGKRFDGAFFLRSLRPGGAESGKSPPSPCHQHL